MKSPTNQLYVAALYQYPIKGCSYEAVAAMPTANQVPQLDRVLMVVDDTSNFVTQRRFPRMSLIKCRFHYGVNAYPEMPTTVTLEFPGKTPVTGAIYDPTTTVETGTIWGENVPLIGSDPRLSAAISDFLQTQLKLVALPPDTYRHISEKRVARDNIPFYFADGAPFLITHESSLKALNQHLTTAVPMTRFRPNIVIAGGEPYAEDHLKNLQIGSFKFTLGWGCVRCKVINVDQDSAATSLEPLKTLIKTHAIDGQAIFGNNAYTFDSGILRVGDPVTIIPES